MKTFAVTLMLLFVGIAWGAEKPVHLFILSGQSNMARMNETLGFVPEAKKLFSDGGVVYIKVAKGGRPIKDWLGDEYTQIASGNAVQTPSEPTGFYKMILEQYQEVHAKHSSFASVTFCWMQGESDSGQKAYSVYSAALKQLIANLRRDLKQPKMAFVIGRLSDWTPKFQDGWDTIRKVQMDIANTDERGAWVDCDDLNDLEKKGKMTNDLHYSKEGYELLGQRFARQARAIYEGKKPHPEGRPE